MFCDDPNGQVRVGRNQRLRAHSLPFVLVIRAAIIDVFDEPVLVRVVGSQPQCDLTIDDRPGDVSLNSFRS